MDQDLDALIRSVNESAGDALERVSSAALLKDSFEQLGDELLDHFVAEARQAGRSWTHIGEALGVTRQAAQQRHSGLLDRLVSRLSEGRFKRFTPGARTAVVEAQAAARDRRHAHIGTEHVLIGLFAAGDGDLAVRALDRLGADRVSVERLIATRAPRGETPVTGHIPFTPNAKKTLERALREARSLGHSHIGTEHIVLALRQVDEGVAAQVLADAGVTYDDLRTTVLDLVSTAAET